MKTKNACPNDEQRKRVSIDELEEVLRLEAMDVLLTALHVDAETLYRLWIRPLIATGATMDIALTSIVRSCFQANYVPTHLFLIPVGARRLQFFVDAPQRHRGMVRQESQPQTRDRPPIVHSITP